MPLVEQHTAALQNSINHDDTLNRPVLQHPATCPSAIALKFVDVNEDLTFTSAKTIEATNLHVTVQSGATLTFRAPAVKLGREVKRPKKYTAVACRCHNRQRVFASSILHEVHRSGEVARGNDSEARLVPMIQY